MAAAARGHATIIVYFRDTDGNFQILSGLGHSWVSDVIPWIKNLERVKMEDGSKYDNQERAIRHFKEKVLDIHFKDKGYKFEKPTKKFIDGKGNRWITKFYKRGNKMSLPKGNKEESDINLEATAYRELKEETSINSVELIKELDGTLTYELPDRLLGIIWKGKYKGQKQKWFLMRFTGEEQEINIKTKNPEFLDWKWIDLDQITEVVVDFKLHVYKELKSKVKKIIN